MSSDHLAWRSTGSTDRPISLTPRLSNSGLRWASAPSSVVHTGVKSLGWENSSAQLLPIQSWNLILPSVVWASKSGAVVPIASAMVLPHLIENTDEFMFAAFRPSIRRGAPQVNGAAKKVRSFSPEQEFRATCFDPWPCGEITTATSKAWKCPDKAAYRRHHASPGCYRTEPSQQSRRPNSNHLKISERKFRIINHSFTPAWKSWPEIGIGIQHYVRPKYQDR